MSETKVLACRISEEIHTKMKEHIKHGSGDIKESLHDQEC